MTTYYPGWGMPPAYDPMYPDYSRGLWPGRPGNGGFGPPPYNPMGNSRSVTPLDPTDFGAETPQVFDDGSNRFVEQLMICSRGLKQAGKRLADADGEKAKRKAAADGLSSFSYLMGVLSIEGISLPIGVLGNPVVDENLSRGGGCQDFGEAVDRMIEKYSGGSRGVGRDIGELLDKGGSCYGELKDNLGF
ncbi:MAG: hypothetical protein ABJN65_02355 [Parasphingorhabdus sp.]